MMQRAGITLSYPALKDYLEYREGLYAGLTGARPPHCLFFGVLNPVGFDLFLDIGSQDLTKR